MIVKDLFALVEIEKLTEIHMHRDHTAADNRRSTTDRLHALLSVISSTEPIIPSDYALLGIMCKDNICRVFALDMNYVSSLITGSTLSNQLPRAPYLADLPWPDILGMEICRTNIAEVGIENFLDDVLHWMVHDFSPLDKIHIDTETEERIEEELSPHIKRAVMQYICENYYL